MASALKPVGSGQVISTSGTAAASSAFKQQTDTLRIVAEGAGVHVAIGTLPVAVATDIYVPSGGGGDEKISLGPVASQAVIGITTGTTTILDFPEGTGCPFGEGNAVSLTVDGQSYYDFEHKILSSINQTAGIDGFFATRVVVDHDSSGIVTAVNAPYAELRRSIKISLKTNAGTGTAFIQQVQVS